MKTLLKVCVVLLIGLGVFLFYSSKTEFAVFQNKVSVLSKDVLSRKQRPASYYQWANELESEWHKVRNDLATNPMSEGVIKQFDDLFAKLMKDIKKDMDMAGRDVPQVSPQ